MLLLFMMYTTRVANRISIEAGATHQAVRTVWIFTAFLLDAYAGVFLGAAVFRPGQFNAPGTLVGVIFLRTVEVGLLQMQIDNSWINISKGGILVFGVLLSQLVVRRR